MTLKAIIVDDEPLGRERVRMLAQSVPDLEIVAECENGREAVIRTTELKPDLLFLDIQMPELDGFGVVRELNTLAGPMPKIIFVTAYDAHAVKAFEVNAIDYLLKPVQKQRLMEAVDRIRQSIPQTPTSPLDGRLEQLLQQLEAPKSAQSYLARIEVRSQARIDYVPVDNILWLEADGNYVSVHTRDKTHLARYTMSELEQTLDPEHFYRATRSIMIRLDQIVTLRSEGRRDHRIILQNGTEISVSRSLQDLQAKLRHAR